MRLLLCSALLATGCLDTGEPTPQLAEYQAAIDDDPDPDDPDPETPQPPNPPNTSFKPTAKTETSVTLQWQSPYNAESTRVQRRIGSGSWLTVKTYGVTSGLVTYTNGGLPSDARTCYRLVVGNTGGSRTSVERCALTSLAGSPKFTRARLELQVADVADAGTDDLMSVNLNDTWFSNSTGIDYSHNDFERNSTFSYDLNFTNLAALHDIGNVKITKFGNDAVCLRSFRLLLDEREVLSRTFGNTSSTCRWLDGSSVTTGQFYVSKDELRATPAFVNWRPDPKLVIFQEELEQRLEGIMGSTIWNSDEIRWGYIYGEAVEVSAHPTNSQVVVVDYDLATTGNEVDIDMHLDVRLVPNGALWRLEINSVFFDVHVDSAWWAEVAGAVLTPICGIATGHDCISLMEDHIEKRVRESFDGFSRAFEFSQDSCATPTVTVTSTGDLQFGCS